MENLNSVDKDDLLEIIRKILARLNQAEKEILLLKKRVQILENA